MSELIDQALELLREAKPDLVRREQLRRETEAALAILRRGRQATFHRRSRAWLGRRKRKGAMPTTSEELYRLTRDDETGTFVLEPVALPH